MSKYLKKSFWLDKDIEIIIGKMLRIGVLTAAAVAAVGGIMYLCVSGSSVAPLHNVFKGEPTIYSTLSGVLHGVTTGSTHEIMQLGVILLIATPIARIAFSVFAFLLEKDYMYVVMTLIVLGIIAFSMAGGFAGS